MRINYIKYVFTEYLSNMPFKITEKIIYEYLLPNALIGVFKILHSEYSVVSCKTYFYRITARIISLISNNIFAYNHFCQHIFFSKVIIVSSI